jgi:hypothetical protein
MQAASAGDQGREGGADALWHPVHWHAHVISGKGLIWAIWVQRTAADARIACSGLQLRERNDMGGVASFCQLH